jgi:4-hydroxybenzoate polyprenyltransferase
VKAFLRLVAIEHSVFALPFAYLSALTAMDRTDSFSWVTLLLITIAMVGARTFAMAANRVIDRQIDARNPRTSQREPGPARRSPWWSSWVRRRC